MGIFLVVCLFALFVVGKRAFWYFAVTSMVEEVQRDAEWAWEKMKLNPKPQLRQAILTCSEVITRLNELPRREGTVYLEANSVPQEFLTLGSDPMFVQLKEHSCDLHLHKGIGRGIGYFIEPKENRISWYNHYQNWERHEISLSLEGSENDT